MKIMAGKKTTSDKQRLLIPLTLLMTLIAGTLSSLRNITRDSATGQISLDFNWFKLALIFVLSWITVSIHLARYRKGEHYLRQILCGSQGKTRVYYLDYVRVTATVLVITTHTVSAAISHLDQSDPLWLLLEFFSFLCLSCNLLFVMVSGALLLNREEENLPSFYIKRASRVAIPMVLYYLCYLILLNGSAALKPGNWKNIFYDILHGSPTVPHFWLIYIILFLYIIAPLLQKLLKYWTGASAFALTFAFLLFDSLLTYLPLFGIAPDFPVDALSWITVFMIGCFLYRNTDKKYEYFILAGGLVSLIISFSLMVCSSAYPSLIYNTAPTMVLIASSLFLLLKRTYCKRSAIPAIFACISHYSFSILLIHWYLLFYIVNGRLHLNGLSLHIAGGIPLTVGITLIFSLIFAILFDNTVTLCADTLFQKAGSLLLNHRINRKR